MRVYSNLPSWPLKFLRHRNVFFAGILTKLFFLYLCVGFERLLWSIVKFLLIHVRKQRKIPPDKIRSGTNTSAIPIYFRRNPRLMESFATFLNVRQLYIIWPWTSRFRCISPWYQIKWTRATFFNKRKGFQISTTILNSDFGQKSQKIKKTQNSKNTIIEYSVLLVICVEYWHFF